LIRTIIRNLRAQKNVAIVGAPHSGKSSLITILFKNYKRAERGALTWFTDMKDLTTLDDLIEEFYIGMGARTASHSLNALAKSLKGFEKRLVIFAEIDKLLAESKGNPAELQRLAADLFREKAAVEQQAREQTEHTAQSSRKR
jgi:ABC-type polysaccharide/polyol phosphate transport system ATPase subunit